MRFLFEPFIYRSHLGSERSEMVAEAVRLLAQAYGDFNHPEADLFAGDSLIVTDHATSFFGDQALIAAMISNARHPEIADLVEEPQVYNRIWRHHIKLKFTYFRCARC